MSVSIVLGTRPQIIKSAQVYAALRKAGVDCKIVNTGQHYDYEMNRQFFSELELPEPAADLNVGAGTPNEQVAGIIAGLGSLFADGAPDLAVVPGDTNSALAAGIACSKAGVPVAHLEAGCRSYDLAMAEEVNRRLLDHMSQVLLCPTSVSLRNLRGEKVEASAISNTGDTMYDSLLKYLPSLDPEAGPKRGLDGEYAFMTLHRAETVDDAGRLRAVLNAVGSLGVPVAFSVHPRTRDRMSGFGVAPGRNVRLLGPLPYLETLSLVKGSKFVITDSGGLQKEAYWLGKPSLIARPSTEWGEIVSVGAAFLVGTEPAKIAGGYRKLRSVKSRSFARSRSIFGDGKASDMCARVISRFLSARRQKN